MNFLYLIGIVALIVVFYFIAKLIVNYVPRKFFSLISIVLVLISAFLGYKIVDSVMGDIKFNKEKVIRYQNAINGLKLIRDAEVAYKQGTGDYTPDYNKLINFIETGKIPIITVSERVRQVMDRGVMRDQEYKVTDTVGYKALIEDFKDKDFKNMMYVPGTKVKYDLKTGYVEKGTTNKYKAPVFEAKISKSAVLEGMRNDMIKNELQISGIDEINGADIIVGTLEDVKETGNWPPQYDSRKDTDGE